MTFTPGSGGGSAEVPAELSGGSPGGSSGKHVIIGGSCYQFGGNEDIKSLTIGRYSGDMYLLVSRSATKQA